MPVSKKRIKKNSKSRKPSDESKYLPLTIRAHSNEELMIKTSAHIELFKLRTHTSDESTIHDLAFRLNVGYVLCAHFDSIDATSVAVKALDALVAVKERELRVGKLGATEEELKSMEAGLVLADDLQDKVTRRELSEALLHVLKSAGTE